MPSYEDLKALQSEPLDRKIQITLTRIIEWYQHYNGQVYISFSGGKDSTVLLDIARKMYPDIEAVFVNTGLEYPEIVDFVKTKENVTILKPKINFKDVIEKYGYPIISKEVSWAVKWARKPGTKSCDYFMERFNGNVISNNGEKSRYNMEKWKYLIDAPFEIDSSCCDIMKKKPLKHYASETGKKTIIGTMAEESRLRVSKWLQEGCNAFDGKEPKSKPMSFWTEQDVLHYLKLSGIPYCSVYGEIVPKSEFLGQLAFDDVPTDLITTGCSRTGCMFCGFGAHLEKEPNRFQRMKETHPKIYDYCMRESGLGMAKVLDFINVKY